jgi:hypothetical protein
MYREGERRSRIGRREEEMESRIERSLVAQKLGHCWLVYVLTCVRRCFCRTPPPNP